MPDAFEQGHGSTPSGLALARCVDPDYKAASSGEGFGVVMVYVTPIASALAAVLPVLAVQFQWIPVRIGLAVAIGCTVFGEVVIGGRTEQFSSGRIYPARGKRRDLFETALLRMVY